MGLFHFFPELINARLIIFIPPAIHPSYPTKPIFHYVQIPKNILETTHKNQQKKGGKLFQEKSLKTKIQSILFALFIFQSLNLSYSLEKQRKYKKKINVNVVWIYCFSTPIMNISRISIDFLV